MSEHPTGLPTWSSYVDGEWVSTGRTVELLDPATEEPIGTVDQGNAALATRAVEAARRAFDDGRWSGLAPAQRRRYLERLADAMDERMADFSRWERINVGYTTRGADLIHAGGAGAAFRVFAKAAEQEFGRPLPYDPATNSMRQVVREPVGVCSAILPWNSPLVMAIWKLGPALAMGNTVVLKPPPTAPVTPVEIARVIDELGFPPGVVNVVTGGADVGEVLTSHPGVDKVSFTGSTPVGRAIMAAGAATIKRVTLELGGKSASIVLADADLRLAVDGAIWGYLINQGQACTSGSRLLVAREVHDEFVARLVDRVATLRIGPTDDPASDIGPVHTAAHRASIERYVASALDQGAKVAVGGRRPAHMTRGYYYEPTVLINTTNDMTVCQEEIFGPVVTVTPFDTEDEAIALANDSMYGLAGGIWTRDIPHGVELARRIKAGTVWVNEWNMLSLDAPFGGYKQSGVGRENGLEGYESFLETKHVHVGLGRLEQRPYSILISTPPPVE